MGGQESGFVRLLVLVPGGCFIDVVNVNCKNDGTNAVEWDEEKKEKKKENTV